MKTSEKPEGHLQHIKVLVHYYGCVNVIYIFYLLAESIYEISITFISHTLLNAWRPHSVIKCEEFHTKM